MRARGLWRKWVPDKTDAEFYEDFAPEEAELLMRVAAVARVVKFPPETVPE